MGASEPESEQEARAALLCPVQAAGVCPEPPASRTPPCIPHPALHPALHPVCQLQARAVKPCLLSLLPLALAGLGAEDLGLVLVPLWGHPVEALL